MFLHTKFDPNDAEAPHSQQQQQQQQQSPIENSSESTIRQQQANGQGVQHQSPSPSPSTHSTVIPLRPSPHSPSQSVSDVHLSDSLPPQLSPLPSAVYNASGTAPGSAVRFDESQLAMFAADNAARVGGIKDDFTVAAGKVTPGVDDTPYIRYAIEALTRDRGSPFGLPFHTFTPPDPSPRQLRQSRRGRDEKMGYAPKSVPPAVSRQDHFTGKASHESESALFWPATQAKQSQTSKSPAPGPWTPVPRERKSLGAYDEESPPLTYKPRILRPFSLMILMSFCILMMTALIFSAVYSTRHSGLTPYPGTIYNSSQFIFRLLPQLLAAGILIYAQSILATSFRILPFAAMASEDPQKRYCALFIDLYPKSFLWPRLVGPWQVKAFSVAAWLALFIIPLQSSVFTCIFVDGQWRWTAVQGVVWTLVAIYGLLLIATAALMAFWFGQWTGLMWDVRSIADLIPLLSRSNTVDTCDMTKMSADGDPRGLLRDRWFDRLGYWQDINNQGSMWYALGSASVRSDGHQEAIEGLADERLSNQSSIDSDKLAISRDVGIRMYKYLPWCLRNGPLAAFAAVASCLLLALLIVSFLPQTRLSNGFPPMLPAAPTAAAFSAANFLYSFLPSLLGMVLFLLFQSLDMSLRRLQPWGDLCKASGATARKSILADYAASLPLQSTWTALRNRHWRVAVISLAAVLWVFVPIFAGGLFMALTTPDGQVRMFPSLPVLGILLAFLFLYVGCLFLLMPRRSQFSLPHAVTCLAQIISLCSARDLTQDPAFQSIRSRRDLESRLGVGKGHQHEESVWFFGIVPGRDELKLSVRRMNRFTEKRPRGSGPVGSMV